MILQQTLMSHAEERIELHGYLWSTNVSCVVVTFFGDIKVW